MDKELNEILERALKDIKEKTKKVTVKTVDNNLEKTSCDEIAVGYVISYDRKKGLILSIDSTLQKNKDNINKITFFSSQIERGTSIKANDWVTFISHQNLGYVSASKISLLYNNENAITLLLNSIAEQSFCITYDNNKTIDFFNDALLFLLKRGRTKQIIGDFLDCISKLHETQQKKLYEHLQLSKKICTLLARNCDSFFEKAKTKVKKEVATKLLSIALQYVNTIDEIFEIFSKFKSKEYIVDYQKFFNVLFNKAYSIDEKATMNWLKKSDSAFSWVEFYLNNSKDPVSGLVNYVCSKRKSLIPYHINKLTGEQLSTLLNTATDKIKEKSILACLHEENFDCFLDKIDVIFTEENQQILWSNFAHIKENNKIINNLASAVSYSKFNSLSSTVRSHIYLFLYIVLKDSSYLNDIENFEDFILSLDSTALGKFLLVSSEILNSKEERDYIKEVLYFVNIDKIAEAIKSFSDNDKYKVLILLESQQAEDIVVTCFKHEPIFNWLADEVWNKVKAELPYVAFDLEFRSDKNDATCSLGNLNSFAFRKDGTTKFFENKQQLKELIRELNNAQIIVGHNIKRFDLPFLRGQALNSPAFIWDTLEIELLLNPLRSSYALHTTHEAKQDTDLVDNLFWNQLARIALNSKLKEEIKDFLPKNINALIEVLSRPILVNYVNPLRYYNDDVFEKTELLYKNLESHLKEISRKTYEKIWLIAPRRIWPTISKYIRVSFVDSEDNFRQFSYISLEKVLQSKELDAFSMAFFKRFVESSASPVVANLPLYFVMQYLNSGKDLEKYVETVSGPIICQDLDSVLAQEDTFIEKAATFDKVYFIGYDIENRICNYHRYSKLSVEDFLKNECYLLLKSGSSQYIQVTKEERENKIFANIPSKANVWLERENSHNYWINFSYNYYEIINNFKNIIPNARVFINNFGGSLSSYLNIKFVKNSIETENDRLLASTIYRVEYWAYQLQILKQIYEKEHKAIIYIVDDSCEIEQLSNLAKEFGFYIPDTGTIVRRLEKIALASQGLLIVFRKDFDDLLMWRVDAAYCYVWDHLLIDKRNMIFTSDNCMDMLSDGINDYVKDLSIKDHNIFVICALWPILQFYATVVNRKNKNSNIYIIDPYLEEYAFLYSYLACELFKYPKVNKDTYVTNINIAKKYFKNLNAHELQDTLSFEDKIKNNDLAMKIILNTLVKTPKNPNPVWTDIQREILPKILNKQDNYLVSMPTGGGKSVMFQGPALYNAIWSSKLSIVISPLKALMQDQVEELHEKGFISNVDFINSDKTLSEIEIIYKKIEGGELSLLYVAPERFRSKKFEQCLLKRMVKDNGLEYFIFDEAHCIMQWGMDFRPDYLNVLDRCLFYKEQGYQFSIQLFTATVTDMSYQKINSIIPVTLLGKDNDKKLYSPIRGHITLESIKTELSKKDRVDLLKDIITKEHLDPDLSRVIVFFNLRELSREISQALTDTLKNTGLKYFEDEKIANQRVDFYHAGLDSGIRSIVYERYRDKEDPLYILCATKAFGMGMDIPNIHSVIHYTAPSSLEDYLQEVGRAGRNKDMYLKAGFSEDKPIVATCFYNSEDISRNRDLLLSGSLSWANLEVIRNYFVGFITQFRSLNEAITKPVSVTLSLPKALNIEDLNRDKYRNALLWLTKLNRFKLGHYASPVIAISYNKDPELKGIFKEKEKLAKLAYILKNESTKEKSNCFQISLFTLSKKLYADDNSVLEKLFLLHKESVITLREEITLSIPNIRINEVLYILNNWKNGKSCSINVILDAAKKILEKCNVFSERILSFEDLKKEIDAEAIFTSIDPFLTTDKKEFVPWYNAKGQEAYYKFENYKKYLQEKTGINALLLLLKLLPGIRVKTSKDALDNGIIKIYQQNEDWKDYLSNLYNDSYFLLRLAYQHNEAQINLGYLYNEGQFQSYKFFNDCLAFLHALKYVNASAIFTNTIELYATEDTTKPILDNDVDANSLDARVKAEFDDSHILKLLRISVIDVLIGKLNDNKQKQAELINDYFAARNTDDLVRLLEKYYDEDDKFWNMIQEKSIKVAEDRIKANPDQWNIYSNDVNVDVNVEAGPGSGKTHILALKCANLVYRHHINPRNILVLAYNHAVVVELKLRLGNLFSSLGLNRLANKLNIFTFHGFAKYICKDYLNDIDLSEWEQQFLTFIKNNPVDVRNVLPSIKYIYIDEFQDITQLRLDIIYELKNKIYQSPILFTIGDKNQSIYGYEKRKLNNPIDPNYYYDVLYKNWHVKQKTMFINYRSFPAILDKAIEFLPKGSIVPTACSENSSKYDKVLNSKLFKNSAVVVCRAQGVALDNNNNNENKSLRDWAKDVTNFTKHCLNIYNTQIDDVLEEHQISNHIRDIAIFFRTNYEVYQGYTKLKDTAKDALNNMRIRVQGTNNYELFRVREIYYVLWLLEKYYGDKEILFTNNETENHIKNIIENIIESKKNWDNFYLDFVFTLILNYLDLLSIDEKVTTYKDISETVKESLKEDSPQLYKIYDNYKDRRIIKDDNKINVVLTTMHKVKGLEFDSVFITPSSFNFKNSENSASIFNEQIAEEHRLYYVACTRAKKCLALYMGPREDAILAGREYESANNRKGIFEKEESLKKYNLGWLNSKCDADFTNTFEIVNTYVRRNDNIVIERSGYFYNIRDLDLEGYPVIGQLSSSSDIVKAMQYNGYTYLKGFYVSDIVYWTYQDSLDVDNKNKKNNEKFNNWAGKWSSAAKEQGFVPIVTIAGYGDASRI